MQTMSKSGISKKKVFVASVTSNDSDLEPSFFAKASKLPLWQKAMFEEFDALLRKNTWTLSPLLVCKTAIRCK